MRIDCPNTRCNATVLCEAGRNEVVCPACKVVIDMHGPVKCLHEHYESYGDGMCYEGCCDRYKCLDCGRIFLEEGAD